MARQFYTPNGWEGNNYDSKLTVKDIASKARKFVKKFKGFKFSITVKNYNSINIALMEAPFAALVEGGNKQIGHYYILENKLLTNEIKPILNEVVRYVESYNFDDSDAMTDYFHTNFYLNLQVGKWDKDFKVVEKKDIKKVSKIKTNGIEIVDYSEKSFAVIGDTKPIKDTLKELGGKFNFRLKCGAGWIFSKCKELEVEETLGLQHV